MASSVLQVRVDDELKQTASAVYEDLGLDLPTAIRMFLKRSVQVNGVPFSMTISRQDDGAERMKANLRSLNANAKANGTSEMTLEEIDEEIAASRRERGL